MIRLVAAELNRLRSRRVAMVAMLVVVVAIGLFQLVVHDQASPPTGAELAQAQQSYQQALDDWTANHDTYIAQCVQGGEPQADCEMYNARPTLRDYGLEPAPFSEIAQTVAGTGSYLAMLASFLVGASFIGAEYSSGSLANWLTFVPERLKVFGSKAIAIVLGTAAMGAVVAFTLAALAAIQVAAYGQPLTGAGHLAAQSGRVVVMAAVAGLVGLGLALLSRHTVAALGVVLAYAVLNTVLGSFAYDASSALGWLPPYLPQLNLSAFVDHGTTYTQYVQTVTSSGISQDAVDKTLSFAHSVGYWLVVTALVVVVPAAVFRRRDVT